MGLMRICARDRLSQVLKLAGRPQTPKPVLGPSLWSDHTFGSERSNSSYSASTSDPCLEASEDTIPAHIPNTSTERGPLHEPLSPFQWLTIGLSRPPATPRLLFSPLRASFSTAAHFAAPDVSSDQTTSPESFRTARPSSDAASPQQRRPFKPRSGPRSVQTSGDTPSGARQLATSSLEVSPGGAFAVSSSLGAPGGEKVSTALPPLPPRKKTKALRKTAQHIMNILDQEAVAELNQKKNFPKFQAGDVLELDLIVPENRRRTAIVRGLCLARRNRGMGSSFVIRRVIAGEGMEYTFPLYSPNIQSIKIVERRPVRRAKLFYLREWNPRNCTV